MWGLTRQNFHCRCSIFNEIFLPIDLTVLGQHCKFVNLAVIKPETSHLLSTSVKIIISLKYLYSELFSKCKIYENLKFYSLVISRFTIIQPNVSLDRGLNLKVAPTKI